MAFLSLVHSGTTYTIRIHKISSISPKLYLGTLVPKNSKIYQRIPSCPLVLQVSMGYFKDAREHNSRGNDPGIIASVFVGDRNYEEVDEMWPKKSSPRR
jgi:hypothetical protein